MSIEKAAIAYIELRRSLGHELKRAGRWLPGFGRFVDALGADYVTRALAVQWATREGRASGPGTAKRLGMVRQFAKHLSAVDPRTEIPEADLLPYSTHRSPPYIYTDDDITALLRAAAELRQPFLAHTYAAVLGLLAVTGMRISEAIKLDRGDVSCRHGRVTIRKSKFGKSRLNLLHPTATSALRQYAELRERRWPSARSDAYFVSLAGRRLHYSNVHRTFLNDILPAAGLADRSPRRPRIHDLRHTFAVRTLLDWYRQGADVAARIPMLSTWLGHTCPSNTYWYLSATPELMGCAVERLENHWEDRA